MDNIFEVGDIVRLTSIGVSYYLYNNDNLFEVMSFSKVVGDSTVVTVRSLKDREYQRFFLEHLVHTNRKKVTKEEKINNKIKQLEERFLKRQNHGA